MFLNHFLHFVDVHVADDGQHGVVWCVVSLEEVAHVFDGGSVDLCEIAVAVVCVVPIRESILPKTDPLKELIWLIEYVYADLFAHDVLLVLQVLLADIE